MIVETDKYIEHGADKPHGVYEYVLDTAEVYAADARNYCYQLAPGKFPDAFFEKLIKFLQCHNRVQDSSDIFAETKMR